jgi:5-methylcytosine-specific restriction enzyme subunit McrC
MRNNNPIQIFEHKQLFIGDHGFTRNHWDALGWYNEKHGGHFFTLTPKGVKFNQYVGVIQVGNITIEILPKISQVVEKGDKAKWQKVLIDMLRECRWMQIHSHEKASLQFKPNSILEAYLELFIQECNGILRSGLIKKYRTVENNCTALKGKLLFGKQIQHNLVHKERFYTSHQIYDRENIFNQILVKALKLIPTICQSPFLKDKVYNLLLSFPDLEDITVNSSTFDKLIFNRKTLHYREAIEIAAMLLLNYRPDINAGQNHVLAILFDMNDLWEEYIYRQLLRSKPLILDTKWKLPDNNIPADADLKQMFVYNEYWTGKNAVLLYPNATYSNEPKYHAGAFELKKNAIATHSCGVMKMAVLNNVNSNLDNTIGKRINDYLEKELLK